MGGDTFAFGGEQNHHDPITDPILIDIGFDKTQGRSGAIIHPYLILGTLPDKLWHLQSPDLFAKESIFGRYAWGNIVPWSALQASGLMERTDWQLVRSANVVQSAYASAKVAATQTSPCTISGPHTPTDSPPPSDDEEEME